MSAETRMSREVRERLLKAGNDMMDTVLEMKRAVDKDKNFLETKGASVIGRRKPGVSEMYEIIADLEELYFDRMLPLIEGENEEERLEYEDEESPEEWKQ